MIPPTYNIMVADRSLFALNLFFEYCNNNSSRGKIRCKINNLHLIAPNLVLTSIKVISKLSYRLISEDL